MKYHRHAIPLLMAISIASLIGWASVLPASNKPLVYADQGHAWDPQQRTGYYALDQGSRLIPLAWLKALKQRDGQPFLAESLQRYGYLANPASGIGLPVGFTSAGTAGDEKVGLTCAACHTRQIEVDGTAYRIDGGPALVDFQTFLSDLDAAVGEVLETEATFKAFARAVLGDAAPDTGAALRTQVQAWYDRFHLMTTKSLPPQPWGYGRLDAIGMIFNRLLGLDIGSPPDFIIAENLHVADAPARYPFLWNAAKQSKTQWTGIVRNDSDALATARNLGQVFGVFAEFHPQKLPSGHIDAWSRNSIPLANLRRLEDMTKAIGPPRWPWRIDEALADRGAEVFKATCAKGCHEPKPSSENPNYWETPILDVGTDTRQLDLIERTAASGVLAGQPAADGGAPLQAEGEKALRILAFSAGYTLLTAPRTISGNEADDEGEQLKQDELYRKRKGGYEARVLEGVWAAAPYLHNGSVPSLRELLKPAATREPKFEIGPAYDIEAVGLAKEQTGDVTLTTTGCEDSNSGNSRCGHEYGTDLSDADKSALLEYLKRL